MNNSVFVDTSGWANLFIKTEPAHQYAVEWFTQARQQKYLMVTSNYIVLELVALPNSPLRVPRPQIFKYIDILMRFNLLLICNSFASISRLKMPHGNF